MKIAVCMKQTPSTEAAIKIAGNGIDDRGFKWIMNPYDEFAVEAGVQLKEKFGGDTYVITMGPDSAIPNMRTAMAMGIDKAIHLNDPTFKGSDATGEAKALAAVIKELNPDIILCGKQAIDWDMAQVPSMIAELLDLPQCTGCINIKILDDTNKALVKRKIEGAEETYEINLPAVISFDKGLVVQDGEPIQEARYASLPGIMKAKKKEIKTVGLAETGLSTDDVGDAGAMIKITGYEPLTEKQAGRIFKDQETDVMVREVVMLLREEAKII
ncbi:MAG: electron transfer flavoprotein subunit beta/FixA family protein [Desulfobacterales bacterium]|nr:electron transfer flavoprotein subunit beta/FixA family protein [Desulfobacterales bacterium]